MHRNSFLQQPNCGVMHLVYRYIIIMLEMDTNSLSIISERSEGYKSVPICACVCVVAKVLILLIFNQLFLQIGANLGCQRLKHSADSAYAKHYPGVGNSCPCYGKCVREVPNCKGLRLNLELDLSRTLLATAGMASATCAHAEYYASVGNATTRFGEINRRHSPWVCAGSHIACDCGCGHFL